MKAFEFQTRLSPEGSLLVPSELRGQVCSDQPVRVLLLVPESDDDKVWERVTAEQFFKGYDDSDSIYDNVQRG